MKKTLIIFITLLALVSFGTVSSVHAFEPISTITLIVGGVALGIAAIKDEVDEHKAACAQVQDQKEDEAKKQVQTETDKIKETKRDLGLSAGQS